MNTNVINMLASSPTDRAKLASKLGMNPAAGVVWLPFVRQQPPTIDEAMLKEMVRGQTEKALFMATLTVATVIVMALATVYVGPDWLNVVLAFLGAATILLARAAINRFRVRQALTRNPPPECLVQQPAVAGYVIYTADTNDPTKLTSGTFTMKNYDPSVGVPPAQTMIDTVLADIERAEEQMPEA